ncbi:cyclic nucleotide-binding domain-containing protein [uncultured Croceitalea sp.]|uniref:Crp/Fnr family transcriptional regulator n=1 Tax=uncultured Croceitalea sp. TaxID=1798908 RepID=UPI00330639E6
MTFINPILELIQKNGNFSDEETIRLEQELMYCQLEKNQIILNEGDISKVAYFMINGAIYQYQYRASGNMKVIDLNTPNDWVINYSSFAFQKPSRYTIQVHEECVAVGLSIESINHLIKRSKSFLKIWKLLERSSYTIDFDSYNIDYRRKYQYLLEKRPDIIKKFSLDIIAFYLDIEIEKLCEFKNVTR